MEINNMIGLGVAGNFAGHLEQAGEADNFVDKESGNPKGIFSFFVPGSTSPFSSQVINISSYKNIQAEPEVAVVCDLEYSGGKVEKIIPKRFCAFNDCSIRDKNIKKFFPKKNWGKDSKGISENFIEIDSFNEEGVLDNYKIVSYLKRDEEIYLYGLESSVLDYSYFYKKLLDWIVERINNQLEEGPFDSIKNILKDNDNPKQILLALGATCYSDFAKENFLQKDDEVLIAVYDSRFYNLEKIKTLFTGDLFLENISVLRQRVV
jgi:hypothetical protein